MKRTILLLDDDASVRDSLKKLLETEGYSVLAARDSAEALAWFRAEEIDLVVMDVNLGDEDGWETFARMAGTNNPVPTVVVTAKFGQRDRAITAGVEALIEKPMDVALFLQIVEQFLARNQNGGLKRLCGDEDYCRYVTHNHEAFRDDLERRYSTPLPMPWFERLELATSRENN